MGKPIVLCPAAQLNYSGVERLYVNKAYSDAITLAGGTLLMVGSRNKEEWSHLLDSTADGVLFQGGCDIHPSHYGKASSIDVNKCDVDRDAIEFYVMGEILKRNIPTFAICRGMQMLNVVTGGTLYQHLPPNLIDTHLSKSVQRDDLVHSVSIERGNRLYNALGKCSLLPVNSMHHQGVHKLGKNLTVLGMSPDGLIESIEYDGHPYCLGVQWHPEELMSDIRIQDLFRSFIDAME